MKAKFDYRRPSEPAEAVEVEALHDLNYRGKRFKGERFFMDKRVARRLSRKRPRERWSPEVRIIEPGEGYSYPGDDSFKFKPDKIKVEDEPVIKTSQCKACGNELIDGREYCDAGCMKTYMAQQEFNKDQHDSGDSVLCKRCGKPTPYKREYCSQECRRAGLEDVKLCANPECRKELKDRRYKYCCDECRKAVLKYNKENGMEVTTK